MKFLRMFWQYNISKKFPKLNDLNDKKFRRQYALKSTAKKIKKNNLVYV